MKQECDNRLVDVKCTVCFPIATTNNRVLTIRLHHTKLMAHCDCFHNSHSVSQHDVICGKKCEKHPGNIAFRKIVLEFSHQYQTTSSRDLKKQIIEQVIARVQAAGGRFIKENDEKTAMVDVTPQYIYEKVSHALRAARPTNAAKAIQESAIERRTSFHDLLATQQRIFSSYQMASNNIDDSDDIPGQHDFFRNDNNH